MLTRKHLSLLAFLLTPLIGLSQAWTTDGNSFLSQENGSIVKTTLPAFTKTILVKKEDLVVNKTELKFSRYSFSDDYKQLLLITDATRAYHNTFSGAWVFNTVTKVVKPVGKGLKNMLLNTKISPDGLKVAFVYENNIYMEDIATGKRSQLTTDGNEKKRNGWFDYAYSEELFQTDGFKWSNDSKKIAFWQNDISKVGVFTMLNNTDQLYPKLINIPFSKPGAPIASSRMGMINVATKGLIWMQIPGAPDANYLARMDWLPNSSKIIVQQLNRKQNESKLFLCDPLSGKSVMIYKETDEAWIDVKNFWSRGGGGWDWIEGGKAFIWASEKDGWRHLYRIGLDGKETLLTKGDFDVTNFNGYDEERGLLYFTASPDNATQRYLFRVKNNDPVNKERLSAQTQAGTHSYNISPNAKWAQHNFSSHQYSPASEYLSFPDNTPLEDAKSIAKNLKKSQGNNVSFFTVTTEEGIKMDGWMVKPKDFDSTKKYPVIFNVYSEPFSTTVNDSFGIGGRGGFFNVDDGYIFMSVEGRGAPAPKGRVWRKAIYRNLGWLNSNDQAMAVKQIIKWKFVDPSRIAVFGGSGGGSTTMHLLFRYADLYQTGIASAGVPSQYIYNSIYTERFMGLLPENDADYKRGSAITYAKGLTGNLLILHGTGDHNVHYQGEEMLLNELIKHNRKFTFMPYPNRGHGISEGEGTRQHRTALSAEFLKEHCPPGGR